MRVIIAGSRSVDEATALKLISEVVKENSLEITEVICGGARGADTHGETYAAQNNLDIVYFPANWKGRGKRAGYLRNNKMAWYARATSRMAELLDQEVKSAHKGALIAIWDGKSRGTGHMIDLAKEYGLEIFIKYF